MKELDQESVARCDGQEGRPAYVVIDGRVYDVTGSKRWAEGVHMRRHHAGGDLTVDLAVAPHGLDKVEKFPQVGVLARPAEPAESVPDLSPLAEKVFRRFPSLRRHPHPMTVHFPIACAFAVLCFALLRALTGVESFGTTVLHSLAAGALVTPAAMATGWLTWKVNYLGRPAGRVTWKLPLSALLWATFAGGAAWSLHAPLSPAAQLLLGAAAVGLASALGRIGASLTFPAGGR